MLKSIKLETIQEIALKAGKTAMSVYQKDFAIYEKEDKSPLSEADLLCNEIICDALSPFNLPLLSEENKIISYDERKKMGIFLVCRSYRWH